MTSGDSFGEVGVFLGQEFLRGPMDAEKCLAVRCNSFCDWLSIDARDLVDIFASRSARHYWEAYASALLMLCAAKEDQECSARLIMGELERYEISATLNRWRIRTVPRRPERCTTTAQPHNVGCGSTTVRALRRAENELRFDIQLTDSAKMLAMNTCGADKQWSPCATYERHVKRSKCALVTKLQDDVLLAQGDLQRGITLLRNDIDAARKEEALARRCVAQTSAEI
jgi:hypothetical protein